MYDVLSQDVKYLKGIGPVKSDVLRTEMKISSLRDMLYFFPYKYVDRSRIYKIGEMAGEMPYVQLRGRFVRMSEEGEGRKRRLLAVFGDGSGFLDVTWFRGLKGIKKGLRFNVDYLLFAQPTLFNGRWQMAHPEMDEVKDDAMPAFYGGLQPLYRMTDKMKRSGLTSKLLSSAIRGILDRFEAEIEDSFPDFLLKQCRLLPLRDALRAIHAPLNADETAKAVYRLKFEELLYLQLDILRYVNDRKQYYNGFVFAKIGRNFMDFYEKKLTFPLTGAQKRVVKEIRRDLGSGRQMNRLLQGDVGSGKTVVALMSILIAVDNGYQACLVAPTEILAQQHYRTLCDLCEGLPVTVELLTGSVRGKRRERILLGNEQGSIHILVGTHALFEQTVRFHRLGLVIVDEQHRFGVRQRASLWTKSSAPPHVLVMTATPIPRTLAMTVYGDLDVSVIDELPPGRKPIKTVHFYNNSYRVLYDKIREELDLGHQVYVVYPLIEESEKMDIQDLENGCERFRKVFPDVSVDKLHGRMRPEEKDGVMNRFAKNETKILVSTTVIEVGVNVPNASVMVIENAERFGLSQLHQLRGRVGRGAEQSFCILVTKKELSENTRRRIQIMVESNDGFQIAEEDLKLRGPGDLEGTQQSGIPFDLKIANLGKDQAILSRARELAKELIKNDPTRQNVQYSGIWKRLEQLRKEQVNWGMIS